MKDVKFLVKRLYAFIDMPIFQVPSTILISDFSQHNLTKRYNSLSRTNKPTPSASIIVSFYFYFSNSVIFKNFSKLLTFPNLILIKLKTEF